MNLTATQKELLQEVLAKLNFRRARKGRGRVVEQQLPPCPHPLDRVYLVDTYQVRRHWRRRPVRS